VLLTEFTSQVAADVPAPAATVFAALTDVASLPRWNARIARVVEPPSAPLAPGAVWVVQMKIPSPPTSWPSRATCTAYDADRLVLGHRSVTDDGNPSYVDWRWRVVPTSTGSARVEVTWSVNPRTFWRRLLLARMRRHQLVSEVRTSLRDLGEHLTAERRSAA
jgi:uncharacterized protein YndB with AHSA1/START domain